MLVEFDVKKIEYFKKLIELFEMFGLRLSKKDKYQGVFENELPNVLNHIFIRL